MIRRRSLCLASSCIAVAMALARSALAQEAQDTVSTLVVTAARESAPYEAPSIQPLRVSQPTSQVTAHFIDNNIALSANYDGAVAITPSVNSVGPNGPGLQENASLTVRGFQDGQYNLTIDGIAFGDSNDFTHHSTSFLAGHDIGVVDVDRGPGTASTLGDATFGGSISQITKDPLETQTLEGYGSYASFATYVIGGEIDTGAIKALNGARALIDVQHLQSNGYLSYSALNRTNVFGKIIAPVNARTTITAAALYTTLHQNVSLGSSLAQQAVFGANFALNNDPSSQDYFGYNYDLIQTDLAYIGVTSDLGGGFSVDNKGYTYAYWHRGFNGEDPNGETPNGTSLGPNNVPGQKLVNDYVSFGDIFRLIKDFGFAQVKTGFWYDHQFNHRRLYEQDFTLGGLPNTALNPPPYPAIDRYQTNTLDTFQPYFEAEWKPLPGLSITPGVKYSYFRRTIDALVNQGTRVPLKYERVFAQVLPSVAVHYQVGSLWSVYAQAAQGFLAPNLNAFYTTDPTLSTTLRAQTTWNYQAGGSFRSDRLSLSGDVYYIDFGNRIVGQNIGGNRVFFNQGGVIFKGVEAEGTVKLVDGFSLYANGSINSAKTKDTGQTIGNSPTSTAAGGIIYDQRGLYGALLAKYVGPRQSVDPNSSAPFYQFPELPGYTIAQLSLSYTLPRRENAPAIKVGAVIDNLFSERGPQILAGTSAAAGTPFYFNIVPRNYALKVSVAY